MAVIVKTRRLSNPARKRRNYGTVAGRSWSATPLSAAQAARKRASGFHRGMKALGMKKKRKPTTMRTNPGKKLSLKQKLHFGTARQRANARLALRNPSKKKYGRNLTKLGPGQLKRLGIRARKLYESRRPKKRTKNIGEIVSISLAGLNPGRKRRKATTIMATKRRRRSNKGKLNAGLRAYHRRRRAANAGTTRRRSAHRRRGNPGGYRRRRKNPVYAMRRINRGRRRNPIAGLTSGTIGKALGVIGGAIGSKYLTQLALGGNNTGIMGYGGNLVASIALGWGAGKLTKSQDFGVMVTVGGLAALVLRVLSDNTSIGQYVNLSLAGIGKGGDTGLGIIQDSSFPVPQVAAPGSMTSFITPRQTRNYVAGAISAAGAQAAQMSAAGSGAKPGMGRMQGRMARRAIM